MPFFLGAAILGAGAIGAIGSNVAANTQANAQQQAANTQQNMFNTIQGNEQPYIKQGQAANTSLSQLLGLQSGNPGGGLSNGYLTQQFNPTQAQLNNYPGYQFQLQQGDQAIQNSAAATTGAVSGAALKNLSNFNQGLAASNYQNYFNQFQTQQNNIFNRLSSIASLGQNAAGNLGNNGAQLGSGIAQAQAAAGASQAGGIVGATNSIGSALTSGAGLNYLLNNGSSLNGSSSGVSIPATDGLSGGT